MTPLQQLASLLEGLADESQLRWLRSLCAREDLRVEGFWADLAGPELWAESGSIASLDCPDPERARRLRDALGLIAEDLSLRGLGSADSERWLDRLRPGPNAGG